MEAAEAEVVVAAAGVDEPDVPAPLLDPLVVGALLTAALELESETKAREDQGGLRSTGGERGRVSMRSPAPKRSPTPPPGHITSHPAHHLT